MAVDALQNLAVHARAEMILVDEQGAQLAAGTWRRKPGVAVTAQTNVVAGRRRIGLLRDRLPSPGRRGESQNGRHQA